MSSIQYGYSGRRVEVGQLDGSASWRNLHPEFKRRLLALSEACGWQIGLGTGWRSAAAQDAERARRLETGTGARMAPSSGSWHCSMPAGAADLVFDNSTARAWAHQHAAEFGLWFPADDEPWHVQALGYPYGRHGEQVPALDPFELPGTPPPPAAHVEPKVPARWPAFNPAAGDWSLWPFNPAKEEVFRGSTGDAVRYLQGVVSRKAGHLMPIDGIFGTTTEHAVVDLQRYFGLHDDGRCGPRTWAVVDMLAGQ